MNNLIFTRVNIFRNLKEYKFTAKLEKEKAYEIQEKVSKALGSNFHKVNLIEAEPTIIKYLNENGLINKNSSVVYLDKKDSLSVNLFEGEHLRICSTSKNSLKDAVKNATKISTKLSETLSMSYNDDYGYLMSNLVNLGAGIRLEADIDLNAIVAIGKIEQVKQNVSNLRYILKEKEPNIYTLTSTCNLGQTEKEIFEDFEKMIQKLQDLEVESAKLLSVSKHDEVLDKVMRSEAILASAYLMSAEELKKHLSILRTGANIEVSKIAKDTIKKLQSLITNVNTQIVSQSELITLAEAVRKIMKGEQNV